MAADLFGLMGINLNEIMTAVNGFTAMAAQAEQRLAAVEAAQAQTSEQLAQIARSQAELSQFLREQSKGERNDASTL